MVEILCEVLWHHPLLLFYTLEIGNEVQRHTFLKRRKMEHYLIILLLNIKAPSIASHILQAVLLRTTIALPRNFCTKWCFQVNIASRCFTATSNSTEHFQKKVFDIFL